MNKSMQVIHSEQETKSVVFTHPSPKPSAPKIWCPDDDQIIGFHMTSLEFKLQNYRSYWDFTFMVY